MAHSARERRRIWQSIPAFRRALKIFREAARRVPAYKEFLKKNRINAENIKTPADFAQVPPVDKGSYIAKYSLAELSWDGKPADAQYIASSSGSTGVPFYWPRGHTQDAVSSRLYQGIFENIFGTKRGRTLCLNLFTMGTWIAGIEFYNAVRWAADRGSNIVVVNSSIEKASALDAMKRLGSSYDRIVLAGYPPFIKDVLESGISEGITWSKFDVRLITAGEAISENWRDYVQKIIGKRSNLASLINVYGMAEAGVVAHETPLTIACRRNVMRRSSLCQALIHESGIASIYQYDPMMHYFEIDADGTLLLTTNSGLPLIRYSTRDRGGILPNAELLSIARGREVMSGSLWHFPALYLQDRRDLSISLYALNIYVENVKRALETAPSATSFSGLFTMGVSHTKTFDQRFDITIEFSRAAKPTKALRQRLIKHIVFALNKVNSEYSKLHSMLGERANPHVTLVPYGKIQTVPGRKHKWIIRK